MKRILILIKGPGRGGAEQLLGNQGMYFVRSPAGQSFTVDQLRTADHAPSALLRSWALILRDTEVF